MLAGPVRLLHTSDWHLGATLGRLSRRAEHERFAAWLSALATERRAEVVLCAGGVFHRVPPSPTATRTWFELLAGLTAAGVSRVVVVPGPTDEASSLTAAAAVLGRAGIEVVAPPAGSRAALLPLPDAERPRAVLVVAPSSGRGGAPAESTAAGLEVALLEAERRFGALPRVVMGTEAALAAWRPSAGGAPGSDGSGGVAYVARLGPGPDREGPPTRTAGSPLALDFGAPEPGRVLELELGPERVELVEHRVPPFRRLVRLEGDRAAVLAAAEALDVLDGEAFPPAVSVRVRVARFDPGLGDALRDGCAGELVELRQIGPERAELEPSPGAETLTPEAVFRLLCRRRNERVDEALLAGFRALVDGADEDEDEEGGDDVVPEAARRDADEDGGDDEAAVDAAFDAGALG